MDIVILCKYDTNRRYNMYIRLSAPNRESYCLHFLGRRSGARIFSFNGEGLRSATTSLYSAGEADDRR